MIAYNPYKPRTLNYLAGKLKEIANLLQMRDWQFDLVLQDSPPDCLVNQCNNSAAVFYQPQYLKATIWISPKNCKRDDFDPLENLYHEVFHIFQNYCDDEERASNILASLAMRAIR